MCRERVKQVNVLLVGVPDSVPSALSFAFHGSSGRSCQPARWDGLVLLVVEMGPVMESPSPGNGIKIFI